MKPRKFFDKRIQILPILYGVVNCLLVIVVWATIDLKLWKNSLLWTVCVAFIVVGCIYLNIKGTSEVFPTLLIYPDAEDIVWRFFPFRKVKMKFSECMFVVVQEEDKFIRMKKWMPESTVNQFAYYVCLSETPIDQKYNRKITKARVKEGFIRFVYSDKLALTLMETLPEEKTIQLKNFYDCMQNNKRSLKK